MTEATKELKWFTIYWLGGTKSHVFGPTIEDACNSAGIGGGAVKAIDWYDKGISATHYYDKNHQEWKKYKEAKVSQRDFEALGLNDLIKFMEEYNVITVELPNKDNVMFQRDWGHFLLMGTGLAWVEYLELSFGEYFQGKYGDYAEGEEPHPDDHYFMSANSQYFAPEDLPHALEAFIRRVKTQPFKTAESQYSKNLEEIHVKQKVSYEG